MLLATIQNAPPQQAQKTPEPAPTTVDPEITTQFLRVRRICVESFGNDAASVATELIDEARLAVRLVMRETGDVLRCTSQESKGAKYKGANADAADKIVKQLLRDLDKLKEERARDSSKKSNGAP